MNIFVKVSFFLGIFTLLHFGFDLARLDWLKPFCATDESIFQHLKIAYWAFIMAGLIESVALRRKKILWPCFWTTRMMSAVFVPWTAFLIWYIAPALIGRFSSRGLDIVWSVLATIFAGTAGVVLERNMEKDARHSASLRYLAFFLFVTAAFLFIAFTFKLPWVDMFAEPGA